MTSPLKTECNSTREPEALRKLTERSREVTLIGSLGSLLHWDQQTFLPPQGSAYRSEQSSYASSLAHRLWTAPEVGEWLLAAEDACNSLRARSAGNLREWRRHYDRATKLPTRLVEDLARESSLGHETWVAARAASDFSLFRPCLEKLVDLTREKADCLGYEQSRYDALLEEYEPGMRKADLQALFDSLAPQLTALVLRGENASRETPLPPGPYPLDAQMAFNREVAEAFGFTFSSGRIDASTHPFCTGIGPRDIRLTTRYDEKDFTSSLLCVLHETGHGLYEQGLIPEDYGTPAGQAASLGLHESQSRLWENHIGRSLAFWQHWFPRACQHFPQLLNSSPDEIFLGLNRVWRSFIRVDADEVTYDLHIILRFRAECALIGGELEVADLPDFWNQQFEKLFGIKVPDDAHGCLQDIHWSGAGFGYFPTYTLGNLNAAQIYCAAGEKISGLRGQLDKGQYLPLLNWLRTAIHQHGASELPSAIMAAATGKSTGTEDYLQHLSEKIALLESL